MVKEHQPVIKVNIGMAVRKDTPELTKAVNAALDAFLARTADAA